MSQYPLYDAALSVLADYHDDDECIYGAAGPHGWSNCGDLSCRYCRAHQLLVVAELWPDVDPGCPADQSLERFQQVARQWNMLPAQLSRAVSDVLRPIKPKREVDR